jgi:hypothetical protein
MTIKPAEVGRDWRNWSATISYKRVGQRSPTPSRNALVVRGQHEAFKALGSDGSHRQYAAVTASTFSVQEGGLGEESQWRFQFSLSDEESIYYYAAEKNWWKVILLTSHPAY